MYHVASLPESDDPAAKPVVYQQIEGRVTVAEEVRQVEYYSVLIPNKIGEGSRVLGALRDEGVNFTGIWAYPQGKRQARMDLVPDDAAAMKKALRKIGVAIESTQKGFLVSGDDRPGAVADALAKLAGAGINVRATQAICAGQGRFGSFIQLEPEEVRKAKKALGA